MDRSDRPRILGWRCERLLLVAAALLFLKISLAWASDGQEIHSKENDLLGFMKAFGVFLVGLGTIVSSFWLSKLTRLGELDRSIHEQRLKHYLELAQLTEPFALYFSDNSPITPALCASIGKRLREWYFSGGGILLSERSRKDYILLSEALTRASAEDGKTLHAPMFPADSIALLDKDLKFYRTCSHLPKEPTSKGDAFWKEKIERWDFARANISKDEKFQDFVLLQSLGSRLRTSLH